MQNGAQAISIRNLLGLISAMFLTTIVGGTIGALVSFNAPILYSVERGVTVYNMGMYYFALTFAANYLVNYDTVVKHIRPVLASALFGFWSALALPFLIYHRDGWDVVGGFVIATLCAFVTRFFLRDKAQ